MWPFKRERSDKTIFSVGKYRLSDSIQKLENLIEFSNSEYQVYGREFAGERNYNAPSIIFLNYEWKLMIGTVNNKIYKIALYVELKNKQEANPIAINSLFYCTEKLGKPSVKKTGLFMWDAFDGNVILQTAEVDDKLSINLFLTSNSVRNFEHK